MSKWCILGLLIISTACTSVDIAPIYEAKVKKESTAIRAFGPFFESLKLSNGHERSALRPLWSYEKAGDKVAEDFLWPLATSRRDKDYYQSHMLLLFYHNMDLKDASSEYLFWFFPLWFQGRDREQQDYYGLFPLWGEVRDVIGYDSLEFKLFPLYLRCTKGDQISNAYLWPFYSTMTSPTEDKYRIFPFYGEKEKKDSHKSRFIMWPFWHEGESLDPKNPGDWFLFFPFYGKYKYKDSEKTTVMWPFFSWSSSQKDDAKSTPWPFYTTRESKDGKEEKFSVWPFYSKYTAPNKLTKQYAWPIGTYSYLGDEKTYEERSWWLPFYWSSKIVKEEKVLEDYERYWPFISSSKQGDKESIRLLSLWPQRRVPAIERNWEAIWELYRYYKDENLKSHDLLWGLGKYRTDQKKDRSEFYLFPFYERAREKKDYSWKILKGIIGSKDLNEKETEYQLLWFFDFKVKR